MSKPWTAVVGACAIAGAFELGASAWGASAAGPYYATPSWDQKLDASTRFVVLTNWDNQAVLDRETGLVWEQAPDPTVNGFDWQSANLRCNSEFLSSRAGWRLPTVQELMSLTEPFGAPRARLAAGHPFSNVNGIATFWSATSAGFGSDAFTVRVDSDDPAVSVSSKTSTFPRVWCVRGANGVDLQ
jgi:hypothetical protein